MALPGVATVRWYIRLAMNYAIEIDGLDVDRGVAENLHYFARVLGAPREREVEALAAVDLARSGDGMTGTLSGGQRSRVSLACALLGRPDVLVLDEPTVGLDPVLRRDLWALFHRLADDGATLLVSSHVMDEAARCDRLLLMRDGGLVADTTPQELRERTGESEMEDAFLRLVEQ